ncbi:hypothetical protein FRC12_022365 [Ceratobasidium sp. 428]|nr:hypothetical protein FRC12_022365 [Ceratobasidium sp. 428]
MNLFLWSGLLLYYRLIQDYMISTRICALLVSRRLTPEPEGPSDKCEEKVPTKIEPESAAANAPALAPRPEISLSEKALDAIWNSRALREADMSCLPPPYAVEDALSKLLVTFKPLASPSELPEVSDNKDSAKAKPVVEPSLMIYCPLEGGEVS